MKRMNPTTVVTMVYSSFVESVPYKPHVGNYVLRRASVERECDSCWDRIVVNAIYRWFPATDERLCQDCWE